VADPFAQLTEEHEQIAAAVAVARNAAEAVAAYPDDESLIPAMLEELRGLQRFMARELALHIAREEQVIFPAFRALDGHDRLVDELLVQHDRVRERRALLDRVMAALEDHHDEVEQQSERLAERLAAAGAAPSPEVLRELLDGVRQLDWILQGHFSDEEDDMFAPGAELFEPAELERLSAAMKEIQ